MNLDLLSGSIPLEEANSSTDLVPHLEAIELWWKCGVAIECATNDMSTLASAYGWAYYRRGDELWYRKPGATTWLLDVNPPPFSIHNHRSNFLAWKVGTMWRIVPHP
jgi:hypothetical protein